MKSSHPSRASIESLSESLINQIAAGEVITRPACVIRELVQNAVDAGATSIAVEVWEDGTDITKIRIRDNGEGILPSELERAFLKHTTSKLRTLAEMEHIETLGFRGEALSAIASVSEVEAISSTDDSGEGVAITLLGSHKQSLVSTAAEKGFSISVSRLFYNTPVRKKFLKELRAEKTAIKEELIRQILPIDGIDFTYTLYSKEREQTVLRIPAIFALEDKVYALFKRRDLKKSLLYIEGEREEASGKYKFSGYITDQTCRLSHRRNQYLFLHQRAIESPIFFKTIERIYAHILPSRSYPMVFLHATLPPGAVDINVHPTKKQVRFSHPGDFGRALYTTVYQSVLEKILKQQQQVFAKNTFAVRDGANPSYPTSLSDQDFGNLTRDNGEASGQSGDEASSGVFGDKTPIFPSMNASTRSSFDTSTHISSWGGERSLPSGKDAQGRWEDTISRSAPHAQDSEMGSDGEMSAEKAGATGNASNLNFNQNEGLNLRVLAQLEKCYIVFTLNGELCITDQHAAHERLNYDKIIRQLEAEKIERLSLVVPLFFERGLVEVDKILLHTDRLKAIGVSVDAFSKNVISVTEVPSFVPEKNLERLLSELIDLILEDELIENEDFYRHLAARMACRMSVMAGDVLSILEMEDLLRTLYEKNFLFTCPHGRPFVKKISSQELAKFFDRSRHVQG